LKLFKSLLKISLIVLLLFALIAIALVYLRPSGLSPISLILTQLAKRDYAWQCSSPLIQQPLNTKGNITWTKLQCQGTYPWGFSKQSRATGLLTMNIVDANLADANTFIKPTIGDANAKNAYRSTLLEQAALYPNAVAGINGGYFRKRANRLDENCIRRSPNIPLDTSKHVGEGLLVIDHQVYSTNCDGGTLAENGRSSLIQDATHKQWRIERVKYDEVPANAVNAIGAGPGLIQTIAGKPQIQITWEGILSTFEFSANAAVILAKDKQDNPHMLFFTVDGIDKEYGMTSIQMANFIYNKIPTLFGLQLVSAMSMDQGNSTTLFVKKAPNGIASVTGKKGSRRAIYDGLFIVDSSRK
jgi:hypothetical protein